MVAVNATKSAAPMQRAMFEIPDARPTWSAGTLDVEADDAGPFERPRPAERTMSGSTNAAYVQDDSTNASAPTPTAASPKPATIARRVPIFTASGVMSGVTAIIAAAAGSVATPVLSALYPNAAGSWK